MLKLHIFGGTAALCGIPYFDALAVFLPNRQDMQLFNQKQLLFLTFSVMIYPIKILEVLPWTSL